MSSSTHEEFKPFEYGRPVPHYADDKSGEDDADFGGQFNATPARRQQTCTSSISFRSASADTLQPLLSHSAPHCTSVARQQSAEETATVIAALGVFSVAFTLDRRRRRLNTRSSPVAPSGTHPPVGSHCETGTRLTQEE